MRILFNVIKLINVWLTYFYDCSTFIFITLSGCEWSLITFWLRVDYFTTGPRIYRLARDFEWLTNILRTSPRLCRTNHNSKASDDVHLRTKLRTWWWTQRPISFHRIYRPLSRPIEKCWWTWRTKWLNSGKSGVACVTGASRLISAARPTGWTAGTKERNVQEAVPSQWVTGSDVYWSVTIQRAAESSGSGQKSQRKCAILGCDCWHSFAFLEPAGCSTPWNTWRDQDPSALHRDPK